MIQINRVKHRNRKIVLEANSTLILASSIFFMLLPKIKLISCLKLFLRHLHDVLLNCFGTILFDLRCPTLVGRPGARRLSITR